MESIIQTPTWQVLQKHKQDISRIHMRDLFDNDPQRFKRFSLEHDGFLLDFSKNRITQETLLLLLQLADTAEIKLRSFEMFSGDKINITEKRAVLHFALRQINCAPILLDHRNIMEDIQSVWQRMRQISTQIREQQWLGFSGKPINTIVNLGIGGSDLGPRMVVDTLKHLAQKNLCCHFVSNVDATDITRTLKKCDPETTLFIFSSKSFSTIETLTNANTAKAWLLTHTDEKSLAKHFIAITTKKEKALNWGIPEKNILPFWDWVVGRYSVWSAIGLPIAIMCGMDVFHDFLAGAHAMDEHFKTAELSKNLPILLALIAVWNHSFFHMPTNAILPYCDALKYFPNHLQQMEMESNGKSINIFGDEIDDYQTSPIIWGGIGTNSQHSFHQLLHQGTAKVWCDFILPIKSVDDIGNHHAILAANCFAQSQALMQGKSLAQAYEELLQLGVDHDTAKHLAEHKKMAGNKPSNTILFPQLTPYYLGELLALYEHKVFTQGVVWQINSFDGWGVECGKVLAEKLLLTLDGKNVTDLDCSTTGLLEKIKKT